MTNAYAPLDGLTVDRAVALLVAQLQQVGRPGDIDLFGAIVTDADCSHALQEVSRVAGIYATAIVNV